MRATRRCVFLAILLSAAPALADTVYMKDGKKYDGKVTSRTGDEVAIETSQGTLRLAKKDVLTIIEGQVPSSPGTPGVGIGLEIGLMGPGLTGRRPFVVAEASRPESIVFAMMRDASMAQGLAMVEYRKRVEQAQIGVKDQHRRCGPLWRKPEEYVRFRKDYLASVAEAVDLLRKSRPTSYGNKEDEPKRKRMERAGFEALERAAGKWCDPLLRKYLVALVYYQGQGYQRAEALLRQCAEEAPLVSAFHQARALALVEFGREIDAVASALTTLQLAPDLRDAEELLRDVLKRVPGAKIKDPVYEEAVTVLAGYEEQKRISYGSNRIVLLLPGKPLTLPDRALPTDNSLPDLLAFKQGVGVPLGEHSLLVDEETAKDALELFVVVGEGALVPARLQRISTWGRNKLTPPICMLAVPDCTFTPLTVEKEPKFAAGEQVEAAALPIFQEMGGDLRMLKGQITAASPAGEVTVTPKLLAGEAAAPVATADGKFLGFLAGKTDPFTMGGGKDELIGLAQLEQAIKQASRAYYGMGGYFRRAKRQISPKAVTGKFFVVLAIHGERFVDPKEKDRPRPVF